MGQAQFTLEEIAMLLGQKDLEIAFLQKQLRVREEKEEAPEKSSKVVEIAR